MHVADDDGVELVGVMAAHELGDDARTDVHEEPRTATLDQVAGARFTGVGRGRGASEDREAHRSNARLRRCGCEGTWRRKRATAFSAARWARNPGPRGRCRPGAGARSSSRATGARSAPENRCNRCDPAPAGSGFGDTSSRLRSDEHAGERSPHCGVQREEFDFEKPALLVFHWRRKAVPGVRRCVPSKYRREAVGVDSDVARLAGVAARAGRGPTSTADRNRAVTAVKARKAAPNRRAFVIPRSSP